MSTPDGATSVFDLQQRLAATVEKAIEVALTVQASPQGLDDIAIVGIALDAAESMTEQFDILPKGELYQETNTVEEYRDFMRVPVEYTRSVTPWKRGGQP